MLGLVWLVLALPSAQGTDIAESLTQLLDNFRNADALPRDVYFGLNLAYKVLSGSGPHLTTQGNDDDEDVDEVDRNEFYWKTLEYLEVLKSGGHTRNVSVYEELIFEGVSANSGAWKRVIKHRQLELSRSNYTFEDYEWVVDAGMPRTVDSDLCMAQLGATRSCVVSAKCVAMMTSDTPSYGYHKTHQVLFLLLAQLKGCSNYLPIDQSIDFIINQKCSDIHKEHGILSQRGVPDDYRDLFMEQGLFCGIAGYSEFLEVKAIESIQLWQEGGGGCFADGPKSADRLPWRCLTHMNGLGVAFYANLIAVHFLDRMDTK